VIAWFAAGVLALLAGLWAVGRYTGGDPARIAALLQTYWKRVAGAGLLAIAGFLAIRGNWMPLMILGPIGLGLLKIGPWAGGPFAQTGAPTPGQVSRVRTRFLDMALDHDTGRMSGTVRDGSLAGFDLDALDEPALGVLAAEAASDPDSARLLEAYLHRRFPGRRENVHEDAAAGQRGAGGAQPMSHEEAEQILGVEPGAGPEAVRAAHRALMKRLHPDQGGSTWLAAKVNAAKEILLQRHRGNS
jgi:hypothetical protein